jgi:hypothetical protein
MWGLHVFFFTVRCAHVEDVAFGRASNRRCGGRGDHPVTQRPPRFLFLNIFQELLRILPMNTAQNERKSRQSFLSESSFNFALPVTFAP